MLSEIANKEISSLYFYCSRYANTSYTNLSTFAYCLEPDGLESQNILRVSQLYFVTFLRQAYNKNNYFKIPDITETMENRSKWSCMCSQANGTQALHIAWKLFFSICYEISVLIKLEFCPAVVSVCQKASFLL